MGIPRLKKGRAADDIEPEYEEKEGPVMSIEKRKEVEQRLRDQFSSCKCYNENHRN